MSVGRVVTVASKRIAPQMRAKKEAIEITPAAIERLKKLKEERPSTAGFRVGVKTRGCNGFSYTLDYQEKEPGKFDEVVQADGVPVYVDSKALMHVIGTRMDYVKDKLQSGFVFANPNATGVCGCGESFSV